jgi:hypothetical protein
MTSGFELFPWFKNFVINPTTDWQRFINPQFNVTINQADAAVENHVLARAGSYGKQLGRMQEVLDVVLERLPPPPLTAGQKRSIDKYRETRGQIVAAVNEAKEGNTTDSASIDVDKWLDELAMLRETDPNRFTRYAERLQAVLVSTPQRPTTERAAGRKGKRKMGARATR